jgi:hypothetical protein
MKFFLWLFKRLNSISPVIPETGFQAKSYPPLAPTGWPLAGLYSAGE